MTRGCMLPCVDGETKSKTATLLPYITAAKRKKAFTKMLNKTRTKAKTEGPNTVECYYYPGQELCGYEL